MTLYKSSLTKSWVLLCCMMAVSTLPVSAEEKRIYQTDSVGNKQYHKQQYQIKDGKVYQTDSVGNIQYHKPGFTHK